MPSTPISKMLAPQKEHAYHCWTTLSTTLFTGRITTFFAPVHSCEQVVRYCICKTSTSRHWSFPLAHRSNVPWSLRIINYSSSLFAPGKIHERIHTPKFKNISVHPCSFGLYSWLQDISYLSCPMMVASSWREELSGFINGQIMFLEQLQVEACPKYRDV